MGANFKVVIAGGGTAGWLTACYLARSLGARAPGGPSITVIESPDISIIGVGEGTFPTIRTTLKSLGIDEARFLRESSATFKQGIRFDDWVHAPQNGRHTHYLHPFEFPHRINGEELLPHWLLGEAGPGTALADAVTIQKTLADASLAPKRSHDANYGGPLNYAYHFDAFRFAALLATVAKESGVHHVVDTIGSVKLDDTGAIAGLVTRDNGQIEGDLYIDCTGLRAKLIGEALGVPFKSCRDVLLTDRAVAFQIPNERSDSPIASYTIATAHEAGWTWDIGLNNRRGIGYVYSSAHSTDETAEKVLRGHVGPKGADTPVRFLKFDAGFRERPWVRNCVAVGLSAGFFEPLESTGIMLIEVAAAMIADFFPWSRNFDAAARLFNDLMSNRCKKIVNFLKMHYCLSRREEEFWRDNRRAESIPGELQTLLAAWRERPPCRFDFLADYETFPYFSYQYVLYGMGFQTDLEPARSRYGALSAPARQAFARLRGCAQQARADLPTHRELIDQIYRSGFRAMFGAEGASSAGVRAR
ncbi:MAG: tryptophan halogenase [Gammaproteobacteria bacterium]|nr:tryptophan halogenase [Gammaproteobacteria bacterium]